jgi:hypothetical protein
VYSGDEGPIFNEDHNAEILLDSDNDIEQTFEVVQKVRANYKAGGFPNTRRVFDEMSEENIFSCIVLLSRAVANVGIFDEELVFEDELVYDEADDFTTYSVIFDAGLPVDDGPIFDEEPIHDAEYVIEQQPIFDQEDKGPVFDIEPVFDRLSVGNQELFPDLVYVVVYTVAACCPAPLSGGCALDEFNTFFIETGSG